MITKDFVKQAYQRARRLIGAPVFGKNAPKNIESDTVRRFRHDMQVINKSGMSKEQKQQARERIAQEFIYSGYSTKTEIAEKFEKQQKYMSQKAKEAIGDDINLMQKWLDADRYQKSAIIAKVMLSSDQIKLIRDRVEAEKLSRESFYTLMDKATTAVFRNAEIAPDELSERILNYSPY